MPRKGELRPVPEDFLAVVNGKTMLEIQQHYSAGFTTVKHWYASLGLSHTPLPTFAPPREMPAEFPALAAHMFNHELSERFRASKHMVARWRAQCGVRPPKRKLPNAAPPRPVPPGFAELASKMPRYELAKHFGCGISMIQRWARECGTKPYRGRRGGSWGKPKVTVIDTRTDSEASRAQSYLQRFYPVWRCKEDGTFDPKGSHFRCDGITRTQEEMIERAVRKGWQRDDWRRIAA